MATLQQTQKNRAAQYKGFITVTLKGCNGQAFIKQFNDHVVVAAFEGRKVKPAFRCTVDSMLKAAELITLWQSELLAAIEKKAAKPAKKQPTHNVQVGDVFYSSWGYEQTNINFFQVVKISNSFVEIMEIHKTCEYTQAMSGECYPLPGDFVKNANKIRRKVNFSYGDTYLKIEDYMYAYPLGYTEIDGKKIYNKKDFSSYA